MTELIRTNSDANCWGMVSQVEADNLGAENSQMTTP